MRSKVCIFFVIRKWIKVGKGTFNMAAVKKNFGP
jgi:hypothetical protein